jgi:hypothetical protein
VVVEVVDTVVSSSTIRDFHQNSFWQHHCDGIRKLYTNSGVHTVRSQKFHIHPTQMDSNDELRWQAIATSASIYCQPSSMSRHPDVFYFFQWRGSVVAA